MNTSFTRLLGLVVVTILLIVFVLVSSIGENVPAAAHDTNDTLEQIYVSGDLYCPFIITVRGVEHTVYLPCPEDPNDCPVFNPVTMEFDWGPCP